MGLSLRLFSVYQTLQVILNPKFGIFGLFPTIFNFVSFRNGNFGWGSISAAIPLVPSLLGFISDVQSQSQSLVGLINTCKLTCGLLPVAQIPTHYRIWKNIKNYLKDELYLKLKLLEEKDKGAKKDLEDILAVREAQLNHEKSVLHNYKIPEAFGEALPQIVLQIYIMMQQAGSLDQMFDTFDKDYKDNGLFFVNILLPGVKYNQFDTRGNKHGH